MHDDYTNLSLSAVACIMLIEDLTHQKSATSLIYNAEMTAYDLNRCRGSRLRRRLEVEENESYWSAQGFYMNPAEEDNAQKPLKQQHILCYYGNLSELCFVLDGIRWIEKLY